MLWRTTLGIQRPACGQCHCAQSTRGEGSAKRRKTEVRKCRGKSRTVALSIARRCSKPPEQGPRQVRKPKRARPASMVGRVAGHPQSGRRVGIERQKRRWKSRSTNVQSAEAYPCVLAGLVPANYVTLTPPPAENMNHQRDQREDQKQMNQKARDMVHDIASNPSKNQQHSNTQPNEPTHKTSNEPPIQYEPSSTFIQRGEPSWGLP